MCRRATMIASLVFVGCYCTDSILRAAAPFSYEIHSLATGRPRSALSAHVLRPPVVTFMNTGPTGVRLKGTDRSPILRSFDPSLKQPNPFLSPQRINLRHALKW